jgi:hypothetical protein
VLQHAWDVVGGGVDVREAEDDSHLLRRARHQSQRRAEDDDAGRLRADEGSSEVEAALRQEPVEVGIARDATRQLGEASADQLGVGRGEVADAGMDLPPAAPRRDDRGEVFGGGRADLHARAVVGENVEALDVVDGEAGHHRVNATRVVADHAAERVVGVGGRVGAEGQAVLLGRVAQGVEDAAGFDAGGAGVRVDGQHAVEVAGEVDDERGVAGLAGEARPAAAGQDGRVVAAGDLDGADHVVDGARQHDADRNLAVVRGVGGVEGLGGGVELDLAF